MEAWRHRAVWSWRPSSRVTEHHLLQIGRVGYAPTAPRKLIPFLGSWVGIVGSCASLLETGGERTTLLQGLQGATQHPDAGRIQIQHISQQRSLALRRLAMNRYDVARVDAGIADVVQ